ncbi:9715_t:CDS:1, partial [Funneliformis caledonium]
MRGHNNYMLPTIEEKCCHAAKFTYNYMLNHSFNFKQIKRK